MVTIGKYLNLLSSSEYITPPTVPTHSIRQSRVTGPEVEHLTFPHQEPNNSGASGACPTIIRLEVSCTLHQP